MYPALVHEDIPANDRLVSRYPDPDVLFQIFCKPCHAGEVIFLESSNPLMRNGRIFSSSVFPLRSPIPRNVRLDQFAPYQNPASADETLSPKSSGICVSMFFAPSPLYADTTLGVLQWFTRIFERNCKTERVAYSDCAIRKSKSVMLPLTNSISKPLVFASFPVDKSSTIMTSLSRDSTSARFEHTNPAPRL